MADGDETRPSRDWNAVFTEERQYIRGEGSWTDLSALCLSGGGIRSAAFCLGALQSLARAGLLSRFDYLSTVSGGGYIGAWLQMRISLVGLGRTMEELAARECEAVRRLRGFTNYLTPRLGLFSLDIWAGAVLYLRNLALNWLMILPAVLMAVILATGYHTLAGRLAAVSPDRLRLACWAGSLLAGLAGLFIAVLHGCRDLPSHNPRPDIPPEKVAECRRAAERHVRRRVVWPLLAWAFLVPIAFGIWFYQPPGSLPAWPDAPSISLAQRLGLDGWWPELGIGLLSVMLGFGYLLATLGAYFLAAAQPLSIDPGRELFAENRWPWLAATAIVAGILALLCLLIGTSFPLGKDAPAVMVVFGPVVLVLITQWQTSLFVALRQEARSADLDREWLARANGDALLYTALWLLFGLCSVILPGHVVLEVAFRWDVQGVLGIGALLSGPLAAWLGKQVRATVASRVEKAATALTTTDTLLKLLAVLFAAALVIVLSAVLHWVLGELQVRIARLEIFRHWPFCPPGEACLAFARGLYEWLPLPLLVAAWCLCMKWWQVVNGISVNRFSMHGIYRNRLLRAFIGSARDTRRGADPYLGFDEADNPRLARMARRSRGHLFPVINMALNLTTSEDPALAERKAMSFTATPLACGAGALGDPSAGTASGKAPGAYVATSDYAYLEHPQSRDRMLGSAGPGLSLGTAVTISGAAASPNYGYHSSPLMAFLMTLFNVRLGAWLPNPAVCDQDVLRLAHPEKSGRAVLDELGGHSDERSAAIYLSDGGHFDNLGLYEMIRRRCRHIVAIDATCDPRCDFFDLGMSIRKAEIDFQVRFTRIGPNTIAGRSDADGEPRVKRDDVKALRGWNVYRIDYPGGVEGRLIYVKPTWLPDIPAGARAYGVQQVAFPHETTTDQWFTESQFESYRSLAEHQVRQLVGDRQPDGLGQLFERAERQARFVRVTP